MPFELTSPAFAAEEPIPQKYTCDGQDISPPLQWGWPPKSHLLLHLGRDLNPLLC